MALVAAVQYRGGLLIMVAMRFARLKDAGHHRMQRSHHRNVLSAFCGLFHGLTGLEWVTLKQG